MPQPLPSFVGTPNTIFYSKNSAGYPIQHHTDGIENNKPDAIRLLTEKAAFRQNLFAYLSDSPFIRFIIKREQILQNVNSIYILQDLLSLLFERPLKK